MSNKKTVFAFSLIELMVVIAIVAVLAVIVVPAYKNYINGANISQIIPGTNFLIQKSYEYYVKNGYFPDAVQLGMGDGTSASYYLGYDSPVTGPLQGETQAIQSAGSCSNIAEYYAYGSYNGGNILTVACLWGVVNDTLESKCFYSYSTNGNSSHSFPDAGGNYTIAVADNSSTDNIVPGWQLMNTTTSGDINNLQTFVDYLDANACP